MRIVIVDDEPKIRKGLRGLIEGRRADWIIAGVFADARSALAFMKGQKTDVLVTDIRMPDLSGLDLIREVKEIDPEMRIIILSGYGEFSFAQRAIEMGVYRYLTKPTDPREILTALQSIHDMLSPVPEIADEVAAKTANPLIRGAMRFIDLNYSRKLTLELIAEHLRITPSYLSELFKKSAGLNVTEYVTGYRVRKAQELLREHGYKIGEVAEQVGFSDSKYFSVIFKKATGKTPQEYRKFSTK